MRRIVVLRRSGRTPHKPRAFLATGKAYAVISFCSMIAFVLLGVGGALQTRLAPSPVQSMKGFAASVSNSFFSSLLSMELPHMDKQVEKSPFSGEQMAAFLVRFMTDLNPNDPKSLLEIGMPAVNGDDAVLLRPGSGGDGEAPEDRSPDGDGSAGADDAGSGSDGDARGADASGGGGPGGADAGKDGAGAGPQDGAGDKPPVQKPDGGTSGGTASQDPGGGSSSSPPPASAETPVVFVYHSHNRESWFPELKAGIKDPNDSKTNITLVGKRLTDQLAKLGIGALHSDADYSSSVKDYNWNYSYKYSLQTVQEAMARNKGLKFFFDIHRDSLHRKDTTTTIDGKDYAQVFFIIGHRNPDWAENEAFANSIHQVLEKDYPGLSKGIWGKTAASGNGEYNQSVSPDSVLIEIGGVDNTLEECDRTADVLAKVIADIVRENGNAIKANGGSDTSGTAASNKS
ncbi:stage II sporulation protein P [Cohnella zeiphila]|uniref:Stage II sporulation protein P n=1 Tax=Cohnella zeiphila TaxID=2761120 RepID=A0A7X0SGY3_9BACL|nr:stage II sporulation protein P [Cohnella zeiphila]MBB6729748.1 stage II sporulation protein P [Cohnella zeiphila]